MIVILIQNDFNFCDNCNSLFSILYIVDRNKKNIYETIFREKEYSAKFRNNQIIYMS